MTHLIRLSRVCCFVFALVALAERASAANMILNGSFEENTAGQTVFNMANPQATSSIADFTAFGTAEEIDLMDSTAGYGLAPYDGSFKLGINSQLNTSRFDAFSLDLSGPIIAGASYSLSFWAQAVTDFQPGTGPVEVGISPSPTSFGTLVYSTGASMSTSIWANYGTTFVAPVGGSYLTVQMDFSHPTWAHVDDFSLSPVPEPTAVLLLAVSFASLRPWRRHWRPSRDSNAGPSAPEVLRGLFRGVRPASPGAS